MFAPRGAGGLARRAGVFAGHVVEVLWLCRCEIMSQCAGRGKGEARLTCSKRPRYGMEDGRYVLNVLMNMKANTECW